MYIYIKYINTCMYVFIYTGSDSILYNILHTAPCFLNFFYYFACIRRNSFIKYLDFGIASHI